MKVLLDACVWGGAAEVLRSEGHNVESVADWPADPGDAEVLTRAHEQDQVLITLDKDFGELVVVRLQPHSGIVRLVTVRAQEQGSAAATAIARYAQELSQGGIVTVEPGRVRVRPHEPVQDAE